MDEDFCPVVHRCGQRRRSWWTISSVRGLHGIVRPYGCAIWENIQKILDARFKADRDMKM